MKKSSLSVIIPSRTQPRQAVFLERAAASINAQTVIDRFDVTLLVGVDAGEVPDGDIAQRLGIIFVESEGTSQAAALNAAIRAVKTDYVAFLEDDDQWFPQYLATAMTVISRGAFVSSTQLECNENGKVLRINDYPIPSGWFMPRTTLETVGEFNEEYRFHLDSEWLGRLSEAKLARWHMVESTAPTSGKYIRHTRPELARVLTESAGIAKLARHGSAYPLIRRLVHSGSGIRQISTNSSFREISTRERTRLAERFGRFPW